MDDLEKYRRWLRARGIDNASDDDIRRFKRKTQKRPYGSLLEFLLVAWLDSLGKYGGTKGWLKAQGLLDPSGEDLSYFSQKIRRAILWRGSFVLLLVIAWLSWFWLDRVPLRGLNGAMPFVFILGGLVTSAGTRLPKGGRVSTRRVWWRTPH